jgi:hypothetical protein
VSLPLLLDLPGRDQAREAAAHELSKRAYQEAKPPWLQRLVDWLYGHLNDLLSRAAGSLPGGAWGLVALVALLALGVVLLVVRLRPARQLGPGDALFGWDAERTAQDHRELAESLARRAAWADASQERFRAVVRELESRGVLDPRAGRTADEVAWEAGAVVPHVRDALVRGARMFDDLRYGEQPADQQTYAVFVALDDEVRTARLALV